MANRLYEEQMNQGMKGMFSNFIRNPFQFILQKKGVNIPGEYANNPQAVAQYEHIYNEVTVVVPCGCCANVGVRYVDGTPDDPTTVGTPAITVRRQATLGVTRTA